MGAFFNGVFLLALGMSVLLQSIERFIAIQRKHFLSTWNLTSHSRVLKQQLGVEDPLLVLIVGGVGLGLNLLSILFLHGRLIIPRRGIGSC